MKIKTILLIPFLSLLFAISCKENKTETPTSTSSISAETILVQPDGTYPKVPLEKDSVVIKVMQTRVKSLSGFSTIEEGLEENMSYMEKMAEQAMTKGDKPDIILFHEFPLTGYSSGTRQDKLPFTIEVPGPETQRIGEIAKKCDCYVVFGSYVRDTEWPDHILSINTVLGRDGKIAKTFWKSRNIKRIYKDREITTTTIEAVRDAYREKYGIEEEFPVLQTEFGNIAVSTVQFDPFIYAAFAMRGTEIMLRTATLFAEEDVVFTAWSNDFYSAMANFTLPESTGYDAGESVIVAPNGDILAKHPSKEEDGIVEAKIPIAAFRKDRTIPNYALEMTQPVFEQYQAEVPINHLEMEKEKLPKTGQEMKLLIDSISRYDPPKKATW
ncbi:carbon-nitrogen hydrolase family protein [Costertonia aggregata]|uniref:Carbon-nitrogen hydrolase family protein n=1 Tax=Costertonia aggregata TaxID=343403 RepID=A0A7H9ANI6_9FLAO|nr:carbon-nitrogen hydrolase family protein [Costertonia aggregata]QLG45012.1 carbon-nitrogen hydrolase family protein [Costertonia aggregata]